MTEAGYYRVRLYLLDSEELECSGCFFKVVPTPDVFTNVMIRDWTYTSSSTSVVLLKDEERPQISLQFTDDYGNIQQETDFATRLKFTIIDKYSDLVFISFNQPVLIPIEGTSAFKLDFCLTSVGLETPCLRDIAYGRLRIEDSQTGKILTLDL